MNLCQFLMVYLVVYNLLFFFSFYVGTRLIICVNDYQLIKEILGNPLTLARPPNLSDYITGRAGRCYSILIIKDSLFVTILNSPIANELTKSQVFGGLHLSITYILGCLITNK